MYPSDQIKGDHAELRIASKAKSLGWTVLFPHSESKKYDMVLERDGEFVRTQVKSSIRKGQSIEFRCSTLKGGVGGLQRTFYTDDEIDGFAVYNDEVEQCFWVPIGDANEKKMAINLEDSSAKNPASEYRFAHRFG